MNKEIKNEDKKPVKLFTLDVETRGLYGDIFRVGLYDGRKHYAANTLHQLKSILFNYITKYNCHVFIHNLDFDIAKMAADVVPGADLKNSIFINNNVTVFKTNLMRQMRADIKQGQSTEESEFEYFPITFHDSLKLVSGPLKKICKDFKIDEKKAKIELKDHILKIGWARDKHNNPTSDPNEYDSFNSEGYYFNHVDPLEPELNEYLANDNISLYEIVTKLIELSGLPIEEFLKCPTTASLAMKVYEFNYPLDYEIATSSYKYKRNKWDELKEGIVREAYYGGRTEVFVPILEDGYHYDVNSLYPYIMKTNRFPVGFSKVFNGDKARNIFKYWYNTGIGAGFLEVDIHVPDHLHIPPLPKKHKGKLCFPVGNIRGVWTFEEIRLALDYGCKIDNIYQALYYEQTEYIFKNFVSYFEEIKNTSDGAKREFSKLMQNSLYGKFGMRRKRRTLYPAEMREELEEKGYTCIPYFNPLYPGEFIEAEVPSNAKYIQPHIAAYVTSLARILLYEGIMKQKKKGSVSYCDTDSIACQAEMDADMIHEKEYGKWALEAEIEEAFFIQPKVYYEKYKEGKEVIRFKGIPRNQLNKLNRGVFIDIIERYKHVQRKIEAGEKVKKEEAYFPIIKKEDEVFKRTKFATTLKNNEINFDLKQEISKGILLTNMQKRKMDFIRNKTEPLKVRDY